LEPLTAKQEKVFNFIKEQIEKKSYPPSVREICTALGLKSSSSAHLYLTKLEEKGYIQRDPTKNRAIEITASDDRPKITPSTLSIPVVGEVTAGKPVLARENIEGYFPLPLEYFPGSEGSFMLRIKGNSMSNAGIYEGDYILVKQQREALNGDIVVALLEDEATVKRFYKDDNTIKLVPDNEEYETIYCNELSILGVVTGLFRKI